MGLLFLPLVIFTWYHAFHNTYYDHKYEIDPNYVYFFSSNRPSMEISFKLNSYCRNYTESLLYQTKACQKMGLDLVPIFSNSHISKQEVRVDVLEFLLKNYSDTILSTQVNTVSKWNAELPFFALRSTENAEIYFKYEHHCSLRINNDACIDASEKLYGAAMTNAASYEEADSRVRAEAKAIDFFSNTSLTDSDLLWISKHKFLSRSWTNLELILKISYKCKGLFDYCPSLDPFINQTMYRTDISDDVKDKMIFDFVREKHSDVLQYKLPDENTIDVSMKRFRDYSLESKELMDRVDFCVDRFSNDTKFVCLDVTRKVYSVLRTNSTLPDDQIKTIIFKLVEPYDFLYKPINNQSGNTSSESVPGSKSLYSSNFVDSLKWSTFSLAVSLASALFLL